MKMHCRQQQKQEREAQKQAGAVIPVDVSLRCVGRKSCGASCLDTNIAHNQFFIAMHGWAQSRTQVHECLPTDRR